MSTSIQLIMTAQDFVPLDVVSRTHVKLVGGITILDGPTLRRLVEERIKRPLLWEEWLDVRERWGARYRAYLCDVPKGAGLNSLCELAGLRGYNYLLLEEVK